VIATRGTDPGQVGYVPALAVDTAGDVYVAEGYPNNRIQKRDAHRNWSIIATAGDAPTELLNGQNLSPYGIAVDPAGNLYVTNLDSSWILKRDAQGNWSILAKEGDALGQVRSPIAIGVDGVGALYVADHFNPPFRIDNEHFEGRIQKRDTQGNWSVIATFGAALGQVSGLRGIAVDTAGNLYVTDGDNGRIQKRDVQGNWSLIADAPLVSLPRALTVDAAGNLYIAESVLDCGGEWCAGRLWKRDAQGNWSVIANYGTDLGQVSFLSALATDTAGNLYVADRFRVQKRDAAGNWSVIDTQGIDLDQYYGGPSLAVDTNGSLYVADTGNSRVQVYRPQP
jgi:DNA-binding beta-propeller fold protein YncE